MLSMIQTTVPAVSRFPPLSWLYAIWHVSLWPAFVFICVYIYLSKPQLILTYFDLFGLLILFFVQLFLLHVHLPFGICHCDSHSCSFALTMVPKPQLVAQFISKRSGLIVFYSRFVSWLLPEMDPCVLHWPPHYLMEPTTRRQGATHSWDIRLGVLHIRQI